MNEKEYFIFDKILIKTRVKELRKLHNLTQEQAADLIGLKDYNMWAKIESHKATLCLSFENMTKVANAFNIDINYFFKAGDVEINENIDVTESLIVAILKEFNEQEKRLALDLLMAVRSNKKE